MSNGHYEIWARTDKSRPLTPQIIFGRVTPQEFELTDATWTLYKHSHCPDPPPLHHDWRWRQKADGAENHFFVALKYEGAIEGMMMISLTPHPCSLPESLGKNLLYVEYLETAPWNQKTYAGPNSRFLAVGTCLIDAAIDVSIKQACEGRLGLHSLHDARGFYLDQGFQNLGIDPVEKLDYFELSDKVLGNTEE